MKVGQIIRVVKRRRQSESLDGKTVKMEGSSKFAAMGRKRLFWGENQMKEGLCFFRLQPTARVDVHEP